MLKILKCPNLPNPVFSVLKRAHRCRGPPDIKRSGSIAVYTLKNVSLIVQSGNLLFVVVQFIIATCNNRFSFSSFATKVKKLLKGFTTPVISAKRKH